MKIIPGMIVTIDNLSKSSYYLYRSYLQFSPLLICPCKLKHGQLLTVEDIIDNKAILKVNGQNILTMTYIKDLEPIYERK